MLEISALLLCGLVILNMISHHRERKQWRNFSRYFKTNIIDLYCE